VHQPVLLFVISHHGITQDLMNNNIVHPFVHTGLSLGDEIYGIISHLKFYIENYGVITGLALWMFGSGEVWKIQLQVLSDGSDKVATEFKKCTISENNMIAITVSPDDSIIQSLT